VKVASNAARLVRQVLTGEVWPPLADRHAYRVGPDGQPFLLPGMGGVTLDVHCGDPATGYASDHLEPGASIRHRDPGANTALQFLTCGDAVTVLAVGQGLVLPEHPQVVVKNCDPGLLAAMPGGTRPDGRLEVHVAARVPAEAIGAGAGMASEYANTDLMGAYAGLGPDLSLGLEGLRIGDLVALADADHRYGRGYRPDYLTIGVISTGQCMMFGHGPGPSTLLSGPASAFCLVDDVDANLARWLHPQPAPSAPDPAVIP
jgi:hypothetical protein